jgi:transposase
MTIQTLVPDDLWQAIEPLLPPPPRRYGGRPRIDDRAALAGIVYQLHTGIPWRLLPVRELGCGSPVTCWRRLRDWQRAGVWQQLHHRVLDQLGRQGQLDWSRASLDSLSVRAKRGGPDRSQSRRPRQTREQVPPAGRPAWHPLGHRAVGRQHPRLGAAGTYGGRGPSRQGSPRSSWSAPQTASQAPPGQGLRLPTVSAGASPPWDHTQDRPSRDRVLGSAGPPPLGDRAVAGLAGDLPAPAGPLRAGG